MTSRTLPNSAVASHLTFITAPRSTSAAAGNKAGFEYIPMRKWDTKKRLLASIDKARDLLGYEPKTSFREGMEKTVKWFKDNWEDIKASAKF